MSTSELEPKIIRTQVSRITHLSSESITSHKRPCAYEALDEDYDDDERLAAFGMIDF